MSYLASLSRLSKLSRSNMHKSASAFFSSNASIPHTASKFSPVSGLEIYGKIDPEHKQTILTQPACEFLKEIVREHREPLSGHLANRIEFQKSIDAKIANNQQPLSILKPEDYLAEGEDPNWTGPTIPSDLQQRHIELTGPADSANMVFNSFGCGADCYMSDFEDSSAPKLTNSIAGQFNLYHANKGTLTKRGEKMPEHQTTLLVRPRGLHLTDQHFWLDGKPVPASLVDFSLYFFHNARTLLEKGSSPYFYLPKLEHHQEAKWWSEVFANAEDKLVIPKGSVRSTVLIETLPAAFQMDAIIYALKDSIAGLNCGRWDYIFSFIKTLCDDKSSILPDRKLVTMQASFMQAYANLLVQTCHKREIHAMGGMSANVPMKVLDSLDADIKAELEEINKGILSQITQDKTNEARSGFDGAWAAHPDLVPTLKKVFETELKGSQNQIATAKYVESVVTADDLLKVDPSLNATTNLTEDGLRTNISATLQYTIAWLNGNGAVGIGYDPEETTIYTQRFMEDLATAEISRTQIYQMRKNDIDICSKDGSPVKINSVFDQIFDEEAKRIMTNAETVKFDITPKMTALEQQKRELPINDENYGENLLEIQWLIDQERKICLDKFSAAIEITKDICDPTKPLNDFLSLRIYPRIIDPEAALNAMLDNRKRTVNEVHFSDYNGSHPGGF